MRACRCILLFLLWSASLTGCVSNRLLAPVVHLSQCEGSERSHDLIVGGEEVALTDPDQSLVALIRINRGSTEHICTASLISDHVMLTAAHCVAGAKPRDILVEFQTTQGCPVHKVRVTTQTIKTVVIHKEFDGSPQSLADVALLRLGEQAPREQRRIPLLLEHKDSISANATLIGFGITRESAANSQILRRVEKDIQSEFVFRERAILIDQTKGKGGFCRGDSGSPIIGYLWGEPHILGINSANIGVQAGTECQTLGLAMNVGFFGDWIGENKKALESPGLLGSLFKKSVVVK